MGDTRAELAEISDAIGNVARDNPTSVLIAMLEALVEESCGNNPALKDYMRLRLYRRVYERLRAAGAVK